MDDMTLDSINEDIAEFSAQFNAEAAAQPTADDSLESTTEIPRQPNPRRRKKTQAQIFKETYLPLIIAGVALLLILIFIIGSAVRAITKHKAERDASIAASESIAASQQALADEAEQLLAQAAKQAKGYDYLSAIATIDSFSGDIAEFEELMTARAEYTSAQRNMVEWTDPNDVVNLSFQMLVADTDRAYSDKSFGRAYKENFITVTEFQRILEQLYANGYMLVNMDDFITTTTAADGSLTYAANSLYLPKDKRPLMITQTQVNYYLYMIDSDDDGYPDKDGAGFASKLVLGSNGKVTNEMIASDGSTITGMYDLVPILNEFVETHPDFSLNGAKATLAVTGYDGLFGYRVAPAFKEKLGEDVYNREVAECRKLIDALREDGYNIACGTYGNIQYGVVTKDTIETDLKCWVDEIVPILGQVDTIVFAQNSDINKSGNYEGEIFNMVYSYGFRYYLGFCTDGDPWVNVHGDYVRQGRLMVTGVNLINNGNWFTGIFDADTVKDSNR